MTPLARRRPGARAALLLPLLAALALGAWNLAFALPFLFRPDEDVVVGRAVTMAARGSLDPLFAAYPPLAFDLMALAEKLAGNVAGPLTGSGAAAAYLTGREVSLAAFALIVACTVVAARRVHGIAAAVVSGLLLASAPLAVRQAHFATTDMIQTAFVAGCLCALAYSRGRRGVMLAAALAGLAGATKYSGGLVLIAVLVASARRWGWNRSLLAPLLVAGAFFALVFVPVLADLPAYVRGLLFLGGNAADRGRGLPWGWEFMVTQSLPFGLGLGAYPLVVIGLAAALRSRTWWELSLISFSAAYYVVQGAGHEDFYRYALPLVPALALLAGPVPGALAAHARRRARGARPAEFAAWGVFLLLLLPGAYVSIATDRLLGVTDTRIEAANWIRSHLAPGTSIKSPYYAAPFYSDFQIKANLRYVSDPLAASFAQGLYTRRYRITPSPADYSILASGPPEQAPIPTTLDPVLVRFQAGSWGGVYDPLDSFYLPYWGLWQIQRPGPGLIIVRSS